MSTEEANSEREPNLDVLMSVPVALTVEVGRTQMTIDELLQTREGSIIKLDRLIDEPLDILVNDSPVAQGVVVMENNQFGIQITDIVSPHERASKLPSSEQETA